MCAYGTGNSLVCSEKNSRFKLEEEPGRFFIARVGGKRQRGGGVAFILRYKMASFVAKCHRGKGQAAREPNKKTGSSSSSVKLLAAKEGIFVSSAELMSVGGQGGKRRRTKLGWGGRTGKKRFEKRTTS